MNNDVVMIELDRPRELRFRHSDMKKIVELTGKTIEEIDMAINPSNPEDIEKIIFCGLQKDAAEHGETLTIQKVVEMLDQAPYFVYPVEKAIQAWRVAFGMPVVPEGNEQQEQADPKPKRSTGKKA